MRRWRSISSVTAPQPLPHQRGAFPSRHLPLCQSHHVLYSGTAAVRFLPNSNCAFPFSTAPTARFPFLLRVRVVPSRAIAVLFSSTQRPRSSSHVRVGRPAGGTAGGLLPPSDDLRELMREETRRKSAQRDADISTRQILLLWVMGHHPQHKNSDVRPLGFFLMFDD